MRGVEVRIERNREALSGIEALDRIKGRIEGRIEARIERHRGYRED